MMQSNTEIGFRKGSHPPEELQTVLRQRCEPLDEARLRPGKYHEVPVPLGAGYPAPSCLHHSWEVFGAFFLTAQCPLSAWIKNTALGCCAGRCLHVSCALLSSKFAKKKCEAAGMCGGNGITELGTFHPRCPCGGGTTGGNGLLPAW